MAHIKASATTKGNRDSVAKRLGVKVFAGQKVANGNIIIRQKGSKFNSGAGVKMGNDFTLYAIKSGVVQFSRKLGDSYVSVV